MNRLLHTIVLSVAPTLLAACAVDPQAVREVYLGPEQAPTVDLTNPRVLYSIGDSVGPGMLVEGRGLQMARKGDGEILAFSAFGDAIQLFRNGQFVTSFGRVGRGPGEFTRLAGFTVDPRTGRIWASDQGGGRLISFTPDGRPSEVVDATHAGLYAREPVLMPDGSLFVNGTGGRQDNLGYLLHRYDPNTKGWSSHHPALRDSAFQAATDRRVWHNLAVAPDGKLIAVTRDYLIEIFDPAQDFRMVTRVRRRPAGWPEDVIGENARRIAEDPLSPRYNVSKVWVDDRNRLWVAAAVPDHHWRDKVGKDPKRPWEERSLTHTLDWGVDVVVEVIDLSAMRVLQSHRFDEWIAFILGPGIVAHYARDLPYPQADVLEMPIPN